jgi:hypothetical protein
MLTETSLVGPVQKGTEYTLPSAITLDVCGRLQQASLEKHKKSDSYIIIYTTETKGDRHYH